MNTAFAFTNLDDVVNLSAMISSENKGNRKTVFVEDENGEDVEVDDANFVPSEIDLEIARLSKEAPDTLVEGLDGTAAITLDNDPSKELETTTDVSGKDNVPSGTIHSDNKTTQQIQDINLD